MIISTWKHNSYLFYFRGLYPTKSRCFLFNFLPTDPTETLPTGPLTSWNSTFQIRLHGILLPASCILGSSCTADSCNEFRKAKERPAPVIKKNKPALHFPQQKLWMLLISRFYAGSLVLTACCEAASCHVASLLNFMQMSRLSQKTTTTTHLVCCLIWLTHTPHITVSSSFT